MNLTPEQVATKARNGKAQYLRTNEACAYLDRSPAWLNKLRAAGVLVEDAKLVTGVRGMPPLLYKKSTLTAAFKATRK